MTRKEADQILSDLLQGCEALEGLLEDYPEVHSVNRAHDRILDAICDVQMFFNGMIYMEDQK